MAVVCKQLRCFVPDMYYDKPQWKWGRLSREHTYVLIFAKHQKAIYDKFNSERHKVNVITEIEGCTNVQHPGQSKNTIVVFELPERVGPPKPRKKRNEDK